MQQAGDRAPVVAVVGSVNADLHLDVASFARPGETIVARRATWRPGGKGANQAAAAARLGATTSLVACVGDDALAATALADLGPVATGGVRRVPGATTGIAAVTVDASGENLIVVAPGANAELAPGDIHLPVPVDAVLVSLEIPADTARAALEEAGRVGALAVLSIAPAACVEPAMLLAADVIVGNEDEVMAVATGGAAALATEVGAMVVTTCGGRGARAVTPTGEHLDGPALPVRVADTIGAGDCFVAALAVALAGGDQLREAMRLAIVASGLAVTVHGARCAPTPTEVGAALQRYAGRPESG